MINRNNKKGFTIVELVIVIAVIAILAAVLIPTFAGIIAKANESADIKAVREMNTALTAEFAVEKPAEGDMEAVINALEKNGFNSLESIAPISKNYKFVWSYVDCCIILLDADNKIVFPAPETLKFELTTENIENNDLDGGVKYVDAVVEDVAGLLEAISNGQENIKLEADISVPASKGDINVVAGDATFDLNGHSLTLEQGDAGRSGVIYIREGASLTVTNGTFNGRSLQNYGDLTIKADVVINAVDKTGGGCIKNKTGNVVIEGGTFNVTAFSKYNEDRGGAVVVENAGGTVTINGGTFNSVTENYVVANQSGTIIINAGTFNGNRGGISANGGDVKITGEAGECKFTVDGSSGHTVYVADGNVTIEKGTFVNKSSSYSVFCVAQHPDGDTVTLHKGSLTLKEGVVYNKTTVNADATYKCADGSVRLK